MSKKRKKPNSVSRKEVVKICKQMLFSKYVHGLSEHMDSLINNRDTQKDVQHLKFEMDKTNRKVEEQYKILDILSKNVLLYDYIIGRITKPELIAQLKAKHKDPLNLTEALEEIELERDAFYKQFKENPNV